MTHSFPTRRSSDLKQGFGRRIPIMDLPSRTENNDAVGGNIRETRFLGGHRIYRLYDRHGLKSACGSCVWIAEASAASSRSAVTGFVSQACAPGAPARACALHTTI